jgi:hypothetical protein
MHHEKQNKKEGTLISLNQQVTAAELRDYTDCAFAKILQQFVL